MKRRILLIGLQPEEIEALRLNLSNDFLIVAYDLLPKVRLNHGILSVESTKVSGKFLKVDQVVFHSIYEKDYDFITLLALWNGPCLPNATAMMNLRERIPGLVRSLAVSKFDGISRGMTLGKQNYSSDKEVVAKWGVWHCGEGKHKFSGDWISPETSVVEDFIEGEAVRIMLIGDKYWQVRLTGDTWLKSIHNEGSWKMEIDKNLLEDSKQIAKSFGIEMIGVDYMVGKNGVNYLLEVNHIPNVTVFPFMNEAFIEYSTNWLLNNNK